MSTSHPVEDTLRIQILATKHPGRYQVSVTAPAIPLFGGPALQPQTLITAAAIQPIRQAYEAQVAEYHELEAAGVPVPPTDPFKLIELGRRVASLLPANARQGIVEAVRRAQSRKRRLRIMLEATAETRQFLAVPWELLVLPLKGASDLDEGGEDFLLQDARVSLVRQVRGAGQQTSPRLIRPLAVQAFLAEPRDGRAIESATTYAALEHALSPAVAAAAWYDGPGTLAAIAERLRAGGQQIMHLLCHGEESSTSYGTRHDLIFTHQDGFVQRVSAFDLAPMLSLCPQLQLVVLQACHSGTAPRLNLPGAADEQTEGERRTLESIALALIRQGVPAVVAMQGDVGQASAGAFVRVLYEELTAGSSLDGAVAAGRAAMRAAGGAIDWSLPVVYQGGIAAEEATWYTRAADRFEAAFMHPASARALRGLLLGWALVLLASGVARWLMAPASPAADLAALTGPLATWVGVGMIGPAIIAAAQRGARGRDDLSPAVRRASRYAQWGGAYLGYVLAGLLGLSLWVSLWALGVITALSGSLPLLLFVGVLLWALWFSYVIARSQWRSALAIAPIAGEIYTRSTIAIILIGAAVMLAAPLGVFALPGSPFAWLLGGAPAAMALAGVFVSFALVGDG